MHARTHSLSLSLSADSWFLSVSGEAQYVNDIPTMPNEVYAAFCVTTVGQGYIANIDASEILVRYIVTKAHVGNLGTVVVYCCFRRRILVRNAVAMGSNVNLRTVPVCRCIRHEILELTECTHSSVHTYICTYHTVIIMDVHLSLLQPF